MPVSSPARTPHCAGKVIAINGSCSGIGKALALAERFVLDRLDAKTSGAARI